jgi:hypothetical protein
VYKEDTCGPSKKSVVQKIGKDRAEKVSLMHVRRWMIQNTCVKRCLTNISEIEILDVKYDVWMNKKTVDNRVTWILRQMMTFIKVDATTG